LFSIVLRVRGKVERCLNCATLITIEQAKLNPIATNTELKKWFKRVVEICLKLKTF
jgi:hypothetical protein